MGRSRYKITTETSPHFLTLTVNHWLPVFTRPATTQIIYSAWQQLQQESSFRLYAFVILENHLHFIAQSDNLSRDLKYFKGRTARYILDYLIQNRVDFLLKQLAYRKNSYKRQSRYQFWQEGSHPQLIETMQVLRQKVDYIHYNPVKRGYIALPEHWLYSSARAYLGLDSGISIFKDWYGNNKKYGE